MLKLQRDLKRKRGSRGDSHQAYINTASIPPMYVVVEQCFAQVKVITGYLRRSLPVKTKCTLLMLRLNWDLFSLHELSRAIIEAKHNSDVESDESDNEFDD
ncbi:uncharacterized protein IUM83_10177 [Phytophthora cinnamomi]|uniref:uncharacterized protein n=1 Tax=Phytophthora cinnamomi TaxID=4785 RepID=UPI00355A0087|nr:hypothetical protein IUM83_10177 [Phytophthora cinnamomi]